MPLINDSPEQKLESELKALANFVPYVGIFASCIGAFVGIVSTSLLNSSWGYVIGVIVYYLLLRAFTMKVVKDVLKNSIKGK